MKKLLSLLLAVIMIFSCFTSAATALHTEFYSKKEYTDNLRESVATTEHTDIGYTDILYNGVQITGINGLYGDEFIKALTYVDPHVEDGTDSILYTDSIGRPITEDGKFVLEAVLDEQGKPLRDENNEIIYKQVHDYVYKPYPYTIKSTKQNEVLGIPFDFAYNNNGPMFWDNITANPDLKVICDEIKTNTRNRKFDLAKEALSKLEVMLGVNIAVTEDETEDFRTLRRLVADIRENLENKNIDATIDAVQTLRTTIDIDSSDITLFIGNVNMFLLRMLKSRYSDFRFYTQENAVMCINFLGNLFYQNFTEVKENIVLFEKMDYIYSQNGKDYVDEDIFFEQVAKHSGLVDLIQTNWVEIGDARANYRPLLLLLGVTEDTLLDSEYYRGDKIAPAILKCAFTRIMGEGPLNYFLSVLNGLAKGYLNEYFTATKLLFKQKEAYISDEELKTIGGLLNLIFNNNERDPNKIQFAPLPEMRMANAESKSEFYLWVLIYMNLNANYLNNREVINNFVENKIINNSTISGEDTKDEDGNIVYSDKKRLTNIINGVCSDELEDVFTDITLVDLMMENIMGKPDELLGNIGEAFSRIIKKIADWFQMWVDIFTGKLEFGAGAFD